MCKTSTIPVLISFQHNVIFFIFWSVHWWCSKALSGSRFWCSSGGSIDRTGVSSMKDKWLKTQPERYTGGKMLVLHAPMDCHWFADRWLIPFIALQAFKVVTASPEIPEEGAWLLGPLSLAASLSNSHFPHPRLPTPLFFHLHFCHEIFESHPFLRGCG